MKVVRIMWKILKIFWMVLGWFITTVIGLEIGTIVKARGFKRGINDFKNIFISTMDHIETQM